MWVSKVMLGLDVCLDAREALASLPESEVEADLATGLLLALCFGHDDFDLMRVGLSGRAARSTQEELQVEQEPWVADKDVQAAGASRSGRNGGAVSLSGRNG